eukprot:gene6580-6649_t
MLRKSLIAALVFATVACLAPSPVSAQETDTLKRIRATETIIVGYRDVSSPFSYLNDRKEPIGYSIDLCMKIVEAVKTQLQMPRLNVKYTVVTSALRIPMVANGTVDLECGSTTNTLERQAQVAFVNTTFVAATRLVTRKSSGIARLADLKGKLVAAVAGTTNLKRIGEVNAKRQLQMKIAPVKDNAKAFAMMEAGEAAAFGTDDILLYDMIANSKSPADFVVSKEPLSVEPYGIVLRKDDPAFKTLANQTIEAVFKSGEIKKIYAKWFNSPIPPNNIVLKADMSEALLKVIAQPTDSALPSDYSDDSFFAGE